MSFSSRFKFIAVALMLAVPFSYAAKNTSGKVRSVIGDVTTQKKSEGNWVPLRVGAKVKEKDIIRTLVESQAIVALPDGSTISVEENSLVEFSQLLSEDGVQTAMTDIKSGKVRFDVQKQASKESSFKFKTGTATAAIRGTDGVIGMSSKGLPIASLRNGRLEINLSGKVVGINGGETAVPSGDDFLVLELSSSGDLDFLNEIDAMLSDTTMTLDKLKETILNKDKEYREKQTAARDSLKCTFEALPDTIYVPSVTVKGTCPAGVSVELSSERIESTGEMVQFTPNWAPSSVGEKKFPVVCYAGKVSFGCADLKTYYKLPPDTTTQDTVAQATRIPFEVTTSTPINICESGAATIEGQFDPADSAATLFVKLGNYTSPNLVPLSAEGKWTHTITISDQKGNWNEKYATVEFNGVTGKATVKVELNVDKTCGAINLDRPVLLFQRADSIRCEASVSIANIKDDIVILSTERDNTPLKETYFDKNSYSTLKLKSGLHDYTWTARDQAGNKTELKRKLGCYPNIQASISLSKGQNERLRVPPPPRGVSKKFERSLVFSIAGVPEQDPSHIKRIVVKKGNENLLFLEGSQQITELRHEVRVELEYGKKTEISIQVLLKNGKTLNVTKTYEVR